MGRHAAMVGQICSVRCLAWPEQGKKMCEDCCVHRNNLVFRDRLAMFVVL